MNPRRAGFLMVAAAFVALIGCSDAPPNDDQVAFRDAFMVTFDLEQGAGIADRGIRTLLPVSPSARARATWPADTEPRSFATPSGSLTNYPEQGLTTAYTLALAPTVGSSVYLVTVTTTYPATTPMEYYRESYYVKDIGSGSDVADDSWTADDPIVDATGVVDPLARVEQRIRFRDGSDRYETIVKVVRPDSTEDGFAAFSLTGAMTFPGFSYPALDPLAVYSSVVVYTHSFPTAHNFSFWRGVEQESIVGVRYYTEHFVGTTDYVGTTVAYEKAVSQYTTQGGTFAGTLQGVFVGSTSAVLAESVFRKQIVFGALNGAAIPTDVRSQVAKMQTHVVDVTSQVDFQLQLLADDTLNLLAWSGEPYYIPTGVATEIEAQDPATAVLHKTEAGNPDGSGIPLVTEDPGTGPLATLYNSIENGAVTQAVGTDVPGTLDGDGVLLSFNGNMGTSFTDASGATTATGGTVEAWVYINVHTNWGGIVHKGQQLNFLDEAWSLQFVSNRGDVAFAIVQQSPSYRYIMAQATVRLNTGRWYYLVATWDASTVKFYINGALNKSITNSLAATAPANTGAPIVVGSQLLQGSTLADWYGYNGKINAVKVTAGAKTVAQILADYNTYAGLTAGW